MKNIIIQTICLLFMCLGSVHAQQYQLASPDGKLIITVDAGETLSWQIKHDGTTILQPSAIALYGVDMRNAKKEITFGEMPTEKPRITRKKCEQLLQTIN